MTYAGYSSQRSRKCDQCNKEFSEDVMEKQFGEWRCPECYEQDCKECGETAEGCHCDQLPQGDGDDD